jgi:GntR family transcriptional regulator / MocR family aminotransferase
VRGTAALAEQPPPKATPERLSAFGNRLADFDLPLPTGARQLIADFRYGDLSAADFPAQAWKKAISSALLRRGSRLEYDNPCGSGRLRTALQAYLWRARGLRCVPEQIIVVNGSQQGLDLCARLLLDPGDRVVIEDPGYLLARQVFIAAGADIVPLAVDREGLQTMALPSARLAYATPSHQYPLGSVMSAARRQELLGWAGKHGAYIIEDDYDSEYRFDIRPIPPLQAMDDAGRVIYLGTLSKTLSPTLRLGYLVAPLHMVDAFAKAKRLTDRHSPSLEQEGVAALIETGAYERHVRRVRRKNAERRTALLEALHAEFGAAVSITGADAGLHIVLWLRQVPRSREEELVFRAAAAGIGLYSISHLYASRANREREEAAGLVMGYASLDEKTIKRGVSKLKELLRAF